MKFDHISEIFRLHCLSTVFRNFLKNIKTIEPKTYVMILTQEKRLQSTKLLNSEERFKLPRGELRIARLPKKKETTIRKKPNLYKKLNICTANSTKV